MRTTEKLTVTVRHSTAAAARTHADHHGMSLSALAERALRGYLIGEALRTEPGTDPVWLEAVGETVDRAVDGPEAA